MNANQIFLISAGLSTEFWSAKTRMVRSVAALGSGDRGLAGGHVEHVVEGEGVLHAMRAVHGDRATGPSGRS